MNARDLAKIDYVTRVVRRIGEERQNMDIIKKINDKKNWLYLRYNANELLNDIENNIVKLNTNLNILKDIEDRDAVYDEIVSINKDYYEMFINIYEDLSNFVEVFDKRMWGKI